MDSATQILDIAERRIRQAGYNAVSYRDIAAELGIKSASLHYHFPKKEDLGVALVKRYADNFFQKLEAATSGKMSPKGKLEAFIDIFRVALDKQNLACLCAVLGGEALGLPKMVTAEVRNFFERNIAWLEEIYTMIGVDTPMSKAKTTLSLLEGAMIVSVVNADRDVFEAATQAVMSN